jgi:hypothetical protein
MATFWVYRRGSPPKLHVAGGQKKRQRFELLWAFNPGKTTQNWSSSSLVYRKTKTSRKKPWYRGILANTQTYWLKA